MGKSHKTEERTFDTTKGRIKVIYTIAEYRDPRSGRDEVYRQEVVHTSIEADGDWLTEAMAAELLTWMQHCRGAPPAWVEAPTQK